MFEKLKFLGALLAALLLGAVSLSAQGRQPAKGHTVNNGVEINTPDMRIAAVRTDQQPSVQHHAVLDRAEFSRLRPYTVSVSTRNGQAIRTIAVSFDVVDVDGVTHSFPRIYDMPVGRAVVERGHATHFWPGGRMKDVTTGSPLMSTLSPDQMDMIEQAQSVSFTVTYAEFEDGTVHDPGNIGPIVARYRQHAANQGGSK